MAWIVEAFGQRWFYYGALVLGALYGWGGLVHLGNIAGFGELKWSDAPVPWKLGDLWWGSLDIIAVVGIVLKSPAGLIALVVAATTQVLVYGFWPHWFATTEAHYSTLRGLVYFNAVVLLVLCAAFYTVWLRSA